MGVEEYRTLIAHGVDGLTVFQETYSEELYSRFHLGGRKRNYRWRLETPDRGGEAGFRRIGLGALLGLGELARGRLLHGPSCNVPDEKILEITGFHLVSETAARSRSISAFACGIGSQPCATAHRAAGFFCRTPVLPSPQGKLRNFETTSSGWV